MKAVMKVNISRWVNSLTPLELAIYGIDREQINRWLNEYMNDAMPRQHRRKAFEHLTNYRNKGSNK